MPNTPERIVIVGSETSVNDAAGSRGPRIITFSVINSPLIQSLFPRAAQTHETQDPNEYVEAIFTIQNHPTEETLPLPADVQLNQEVLVRTFTVDPENPNFRRITGESHPRLRNIKSAILSRNEQREYVLTLNLTNES